MTGIRQRILVVDDDAAVRALMLACVGNAGFRVDAAADAAECRAMLDGYGVDLVLLDLNLPDGNGLTLAREIRARHGVAVIMVTERGSPDERAQGLEIGADDYIAKPVYPRELLARIRNVLERRAGSLANPASPHLLRLGRWTLDTLNRTLTGGDGRALDLTPAEFDLIAILASRMGRIQSRDALMDALGSAETEAGPRSIDILISRLRKKLGADGGMIETCRGHGYRFVAP